MAQHDFVINNQGFPAFRADLNDFLSAVKTTHSGSSLPSGAAAGTIWLDTSSATVPLLKYYDGADNILLATINHTTNTVSFSGAGGDLVNDLTPQLGGNLDTNTHSIVTTSNANVKLYPNGTGKVEIGGATNSGRIQLNCETNSHGIVLASPPHSAGMSYTLTFPQTNPSAGKVLQTDGSGNLSFASVVGSLSTPLVVTGDATAGSEIRLPEDTDNGSNYVALKAANSIASNVTFTLPSADGTANQVLQTNGSGVLSFANVSASAGQVIQVVSTTKTDTFSTTGLGFTDVTGLSVSITPSSASNKILVFYSTTVSATAHQYSAHLRLVRGSTEIYIGDADGNRTRASSGYWSPSDGHHLSDSNGNFLDSPSTTSATTYKLQLQSGYSGQTVYINRNYTDSNGTEHSRTASTITVMEVKG